MYLRNTNFLPQPLGALIHSASVMGSENFVLKVTPGIASEFRCAFYGRLAKLSRHPNYDPTSEGLVLEQLIQHFTLE